MIGTRLGPYEISAKLGEGGMGQVWKARDFHLGRDVALKVLPEGFTSDSERLARFEREAKLLAQLNHPNIAQIYGFEASGDTRALVMELVEGPTLAERLEQGNLPFNESLSISLQIAQALEEAHEKGIVHRDLKPQNVKASREGKVKVLDFGLAKAMDPTAGSAASAADLGGSPTLMQSPTLTAAHGTQLGVILGTAAYMAPEQARGVAVDKRADIWAFGVVLWEMLAGRRLFDGELVTDVLADVLRKEVDLTTLSAETPASIRGLLRRCLERNPKNRLHDIADARLVLEDALAGRGDESVVSGAALAAPAPRRAAWQPWLFGFLLGAAAVALVAVLLRTRATAPRAEFLRFTISSSSGARISGGAGNSAIAPDGRRVAFVGSDAEGRQGLWIQELDQVRARLLAGSEDATYPFWAPDSARVAFFAKGKLHRVSLADGRVIELGAAPEGRGGSWGRGGTIVFAPAVVGGLSAVSEAGGAPVPVTRIEKPAEEISHRYPSFLPDGKRFVYIADPGANVEEGRVFLASLDGGARRLLYRSRRAPVYAEPGFLIDAIGDRLAARRFDPESGELSGEPLRLEEATPGYVNTQDRAASVSTSGTLLVPSAARSGTKVLWLDRRGRPIGEVPLPKGSYDMPRLSPDGRRLVLVAPGAKESEFDLWVVDLLSEQASRLTFDPGAEQYPIWSPDGEQIVFQTDRGAARDLWIRPSRGGGGERALFESPHPWKVPDSWAGELLAFTVTDAATGFDIWLLRPDRAAEAPRPLLASPAAETTGAISPDGRWLAYVSNESGRPEIFVVSLPDARTKYQVTTEGAAYPTWTRNGRELVYFSASAAFAAVPVTPGEALSFGAPVTLFPKPRISWGISGDDVLFDVAPDGERIVLLEPTDEGSQTLIVVTDWRAELGAEGAGR